MSPGHTTVIRDLAGERHLFRVRSVIGFTLILLALSVLLLRFIWLQVVQHDQFTTRSDENRVKLRPIAPNRGLILDRNGVILAENLPAYRLEVTPERVDDMQGTLDELGKLLDISDDDIAQFERLRRHRPFQGIPLRLRLSETETARFAVNQHRFPGVEVVPYLTRHYPHGEIFAHVVGYVSRLNEDDLRTLDSSNYSATTHAGRVGIERFYEDLLHGRVGHEQVETNAQGRLLREVSREPPAPGQDLYLTIDLRMQRAAVNAMGDFNGAAVAIDPRSGEVLALVSRPAFDPNKFVGGISQDDYQRLVNSPDQPLFNRAIQGRYEPGSTIKPFIALAGLHNGVLNPNDRIVSRGYYQLPGQEHRYRDWKREGHGEVGLRLALAESVNVFFYDQAVKLGIDRIHDFLQPFGFGSQTGIDLPGEGSGILPSRQWKRATLGEAWFPGETVITGIGQGFISITPLQLASANATLAARGVRRQVHLLGSSLDPVNGHRTEVEPTITGAPVMTQRADWERVIDAMESVVHDRRGTAPMSGLNKDLRVAGKTGTAQVFGLGQSDEYKDRELPEHLRHHALFIAFAPADDPRIAVAVVAEHGGGGGRVAAPIARDIIQAWLTLEGEKQ